MADTDVASELLAFQFWQRRTRQHNEISIAESDQDVSSSVCDGNAADWTVWLQWDGRSRS